MCCQGTVSGSTLIFPIILAPVRFLLQEVMAEFSKSLILLPHQSSGEVLCINLVTKGHYCLQAVRSQCIKGESTLPRKLIPIVWQSNYEKPCPNFLLLHISCEQQLFQSISYFFTQCVCVFFFTPVMLKLDPSWLSRL